MMSGWFPFSFGDVASSGSWERRRRPGLGTQVTGLQHSTVVKCSHLSKGKPSPPLRLGVAGRDLPRHGGDGRLCKPLNKVALSPRLTRNSLASSPGVSQRRVPESQLYAPAGDALPWGRRGSEGHRGPSARP